MVKGGFCRTSFIQPQMVMSANHPLLPVDLVKLHGISHGDTAVIQETADAYFLQADEILELIEQARLSKDVEVIKRLVHKFRGSTVTLGIYEVGEILLKMDESLAERDLTKLRSLMDQTRNSLRKTHMFIKTYLRN